MGNVAFWDGHVQAVRAAVPPASVATSISASTYTIVSSMKIGFLARSPVDWSSSGTMFSSTWTQFCYGGFDYYFWIGQK
jgi:prepilin-type processing-associated H-X9-DG protein